jgi:hypothetical protein
MALSDEELLDFDLKRLGERGPRSILEEHGDVYRQQLIVARWIEHWAIGLEENRVTEPGGESYYEGMAAALRDVTAHLRQGDLLPGGVLYEDTMARRLKQDESDE